MNQADKPWIRSIKHHSYWNIVREVDTLYQVDSQQDADTIVALNFGVIEHPPAKATRQPEPPAAVNPQTEDTSVSVPKPRGRTAKVMNSADIPAAKPKE